MLFIKIAVSFTSLIPCLVLPRELRETTEGTPKEDHMTKKALFLRLSPKKVDLIPEKVVSPPKKVDSFPKIASSFGDSLYGSARKKTSYSNKKYTFLSKKCIFLEILTSFSSLLYYLCSGFQKKHKNIIIITLTFAYLQKKSYLCGVIKSINFKITTL